MIKLAKIILQYINANLIVITNIIYGFDLRYICTIYQSACVCAFKTSERTFSTYNLICLMNSSSINCTSST